MTPTQYDELIHALRRQPMPLSKLHAIAVEGGSTWSVDQLHLMLACMEGVELKPDNAGDPVITLGRLSPREELADAMLEVVRAQGQPIPAAQIMHLLPGRFTTSVEQIKKLARETRGLKVVGPGLIGLDS